MFAPFLFAVLSATVAGSSLPPGFVGRTVCASCHEDVAQAFANGPHGRAMALSREGVLERSCESCHGPGAQHAQDPLAGHIRGRGTAAETMAAACGQCHAWPAVGQNLQAPAHARAGVSCLSCHQSGHQAAKAERLLRGPEEQLCGSCHPRERSEFSLPFAHREGRSPLPCSNCHGIHQELFSSLGIPRDPQKRCVSCHGEKGGPFLYPHPAGEAGGCVRCHEAHGSPNPQLLVRPEALWLCLECHAQVPPSHNLSNASYRQCVACHAAVHGSHRSVRLFTE